MKMFCSKRAGLRAVLCVATIFFVSLCVLGFKRSAPHRRLLLEGLAIANSDIQRTFLSELGRSIPALIICLSVGAVATAAGVGGGPIFVPIFSVLAGFSIKGATALSQATIAGGAIAGVSLSLRRRSPIDPSQPILNLPLALIFTPVLLLGVSIGVLGNVLLPTWLITLLLIVLLLVLAYMTFTKAIKLHRKERKHAASLVPLGTKPDPNPVKGLQGPAPTQGKAGAPPPACSANGSDVEEGTCTPASQAAQTACNIELANGGGSGAQVAAEPTCADGGQRAGEGDSAPHAAPRQASVAVQAAETVLMWGGFLALQLVKTRFQRCSGAYLGLFAVQIVLSLAASAFFAWQARNANMAVARRQAQAGNQLQQPMLDHIYGVQPVWTPPRLLRATFISLVGGFVAGLFGIGGGMIMGPLLLEFGLHPMVSAATSGLMVLFSSSIAAFSFGFDGLLNTQYALIFGIGCFLASLLGVLLVARAVKRSGKASIVVFLLAMVIGIGALLTAVFGGRNAVSDLSTHSNTGFGSFCGAASA